MGQVTPLLEFLENAGLVHGSRINESRIRRLSTTRLSDIGEEAAGITRAENLAPAIGAMSHAVFDALTNSVSSRPSTAIVCISRTFCATTSMDARAKVDHLQLGGARRLSMTLKF